MKTQNISLSGNEKIGLISNLSTMLAAGIPILEAVESIKEDSKGNTKKILETLKEDMTQGKTISFSFAKFPKTFDKVTVNIIKASEEAGTLDVALKDLKDNIRKSMEFSDKIRSALVYPIVILVVFLGVMVLILTFVIPKIATVFQRLKVDLPLPTKILIAISNFLLNYTITTLIVIVAVIALFFFFYKTQRKILLNMLTSLPLISRLAKEIDLTQFSHSLYLLLNAGIPITNALELTEEVVVKKEISKVINHSKEVILAGKNLSDGLKDHKKVIPSIMIKITEAGEHSGSLDRSMQDISEYLDYQVSKTLHTVTILMEPLLLVLVGVLVGGMMMSIIAPIYGIIGQVGNR